MNKIIILIFLFTCALHSQNLVQAEYFWDLDPGEGNGYAMQAVDGNFNTAMESVLADNAVLPAAGMHTIGIRVKGVNGNWSPVYRKVFVLSGDNSTNNTAKITQAEYFWDNDPGQGNGTALLAFDGNFSNAIETVLSNDTALPEEGNHTFAIRIKGDDGNWSPVYRKVFNLSGDNSTNNTAKITQAEYFWNDDPGQGNGNVMLAFDGDFTRALESIIADNALYPDAGLNILRIRTKGDDGNWGPVYSKVVMIDSENEDQVTLVYPENGAVNVPVTDSLSWNTLPGAESYEYECATDSNFSDVVQSGIIIENTVDFSGLEFSTTYFWRVRLNDNTGVGIWSDIWSFTTADNLGVSGLSKVKIILYPNPTHDYVTVSSNKDDFYTFSIYTNDGKEISKGKLINNRISLQNLSSAVYIIKLTGSRGNSEEFKVLKN
ncbi:T9SS type A sorting domain-containing protein [Flavobacterium sp.]|uniref:T9SS type A sorting domain-containing protein n=1 Tax=Flavobacterium sp. TaxID=239 RepID=UPI00260793D8|nr:T9SS type A sorting domain-containing protein [Flavobacterium sp.]